MKHYINTNKELFGIEQGQEFLVQSDWIEVSLEEIEAMNKAKEDAYKATIEYKISEAKAYLISTDWYIIRYADSGKEVPSDIKIKREEARISIGGINE